MCFSVYWLVHTLISLVTVCGVVAICRKLLPYGLSLLGVVSELVMSVINIIVGVIVICWVLYLLLEVLSCVSLR